MAAKKQKNGQRGVLQGKCETAGAEEIIVAHNHPSGDLTPSKADVSATKKLRATAQLLGVTLLDHLIIGASDSPDGADFTSLAEMLQGE